MAESRSDNAVAKIDGFRILSTLGIGGMGRVYKAEQDSPRRIVALKVLHRRLSQDIDYVKRFLREVRAAAMVDHDHIIAGYGVGESEGTYYFAMEYVDGETLGERIRREGALSEEDALRITMEIADALHHVAQLGLVHRDVKPGNVMLARDGRSKLCDLGLARQASATADVPAIGTPRYIAPEQARGGMSLDSRADIYSLGATLFTMVSGVPAYDGGTTTVLREKLVVPVKSKATVRRGVSLATCNLIDRMMARRRANRHDHPGQVVDEIREILERLAEAADLVSFDDMKPLEFPDDVLEDEDIPIAVPIADAGPVLVRNARKPRRVPSRRRRPRRGR